MTVEEAACELPDDVEAVWAADEEGGGWLQWIDHTGDGLLWPAPCCWAIGRRRFPVRHDLYFSDESVLAFTMNGSVLAGLFRLDGDGPRHLAAVFRLACGQDAEPPLFLLP